MKLAGLMIALVTSNAWVPYYTSPLGNIHYYDLSTAKLSDDGKTGKVRARIEYGIKAREAIKEVFGKRAEVTSISLGFLVFQCSERVYEFELTEDFDESGARINRSPIGIELAVPPTAVTHDLEPAFSAACHR